MAGLELVQSLVLVISLVGAVLLLLMAFADYLAVQQEVRHGMKKRDPNRIYLIIAAMVTFGVAKLLRSLNYPSVADAPFYADAIEALVMLLLLAAVYLDLKHAARKVVKHRA